jgi:hypothetical protein
MENTQVRLTLTESEISQARKWLQDNAPEVVLEYYGWLRN